MSRMSRSYSALCLALCGFLLALAWTPAVAGAASGTGELIICHTNDMHARVQSEDDWGKAIGLAELAAAVKAVRAEHPATLWLDAGDTIHGMPMINVTKGESMAPLLNEAGLDAMAPGNHDFNYGFEQLLKVSKEMKFPVLCANLVREQNGKQVFPGYKIFRLKGLKVGVFGLSTPETAYSCNPDNVAGLKFQNPVERAREMVKKLRPGCDVVIGLMHLGLNEHSEFTSERIAREVKGIDLIVDGHSHTTLPEGMQVGKTLIVQTGWHDHRLGEVKLKVESHKVTEAKARLLSKDELQQMGVKPDERIERAMAMAQERSEALFQQVVTYSDRKLSGERLVLRRQETELGNLCADAIRWQTGAEIAVQNGGGVRTDLPMGNVTRGDCLAIFPFGNVLRMAEVQGKVIRQMMEHSFAGYPSEFGGFLDFSGMTVTCDPTLPVGHRIKEIKVNGVPLDDERIYTLAANDFLFAGGDGYDMLKGAKIVGESGTCEEVLANYLNQVGMKGIETGRLKMLKELELPPAEADMAEAA